VANKFQIEVTAADKATSVIDRINKKVGDATNRFSKAGAGLGLPDAGDFSKIGKGIAEVGGVAGSAAAKIASLSAPVAELMGAGTLAGLVAMVDKWMQAGAAMTRTSHITGVATDDLQKLAGAGRLVGVSSDTMMNSLHSLGNVMEAAEYNRNPAALAAFNALHLTMRRTATGAQDSADMFVQLGDAVKNGVNPQAAEALMSMIAIPPEVYELLHRGSAEIKALEDEVVRLGAVMSPDAVNRADQLAAALNRLGVAADGAKNRLIDANTHGAASWFDNLTNILVHPDEAAEELKKARTWVAVVKEVAKHVDAGVGLNEDLNSKIRATLLPKMNHAPLTIGDANVYTARMVRGALPAALMTPAAASADAYVDRVNKATPGGSGDASPNHHTLADRNNNPGNLRSWGNSPVVNGYAQFPDQETGLSAAVANLMAKRQHGLNTINGIIGDPTWGWAPAKDGNNVPAYANTVSGATGKGADDPLDLTDRQTLASMMKGIVKQEGGSPISDEKIYAAVDYRLAGQQGQQPAQGQPQHIEVTIHNAPAGMTATAQTNSGAVGMPRINYAMPTTVTP